MPFKSLGTVSYSPPMVTMAVSVAICEIFSVKEWCDLQNRVRVRSRSLKMAPFDRSHKSSYTVLGKRCRQFLRHSHKIGRLALRTVCQYHSVVNHAVVQFRRKRTLLHWNKILDLHTGMTNEQFFVFSPSYFSVLILTSSL